MPRKSTSPKKLIESILLEAQYYKSLLKKPTFNTLYIGGGTPSFLSSILLRQLFEGLFSLFDASSFEEITLEANPKTFRREKARIFKEMGVSRVSLGAQAFNDSLLQDLGRNHSVNDILESYSFLREEKIDEINLDLMFGISSQTLKEWEETLEKVIQMSPEHISCYNLNYEKGTLFFEQLRKGDLSENEEKNREFFLYARKRLTENGYLHYEISNYALPTKQSKHNQGYWEGRDYLGLGPSAVSALQGVRQKNLPSTENYISQAHKNPSSLVFSKEKITPEKRKMERVLLSLRTASGIAKEEIKEKGNQISLLKKNQLIFEEGGYLKLNAEGFLVADEIASLLT